MRTLLLLMTVVFFNTSHAAGLGVRVGTTGLGADFGWGILPTLGGRIGVSGMSFNTDVETTDINYDADANLAMVNGFLDWSPLGPFRITAGLIANNNKVDLVGRPRNATFPPGSTLTGTVKPEHSAAPYLGIGYGNVWTKGVNFYFDLGIIFQGTPKVDLTANCAPSPACTAAQSRVAAEEQRVQDELNKFKYYPVLNIGITIGF